MLVSAASHQLFLPPPFATPTQQVEHSRSSVGSGALDQTGRPKQLRDVWQQGAQRPAKQMENTHDRVSSNGASHVSVLFAITMSVSIRGRPGQKAGIPPSRRNQSELRLRRDDRRAPSPVSSHQFAAVVCRGPLCVMVSHNSQRHCEQGGYRVTTPGAQRLLRGPSGSTHT